MTDEKFDVAKHILVPKHSKATEEETQKLLDQYNIAKKQLPKILKSDPAIRNLDPKIGEVIKIERQSPTVGKVNFYRVVVNG